MLCFDQAFSEGTTSTFDYSLKEKAPFTIRNSLGIPFIVEHSANLRLVGSAGQGKLHELPVDQNMELEHSMFEPTSRGKLSALQRQESCLFNLTIGQTFPLVLCWCCALSYAKLAIGDVLFLSPYSALGIQRDRQHPCGQTGSTPLQHPRPESAGGHICAVAD